MVITPFTRHVVELIQQGMSVADIAEQTKHTVVMIMKHVERAKKQGLLKAAQVGSVPTEEPKRHKFGTENEKIVKQIADLARDRVAPTEISRQLGYSRTIVYRYLDRAKANGFIDNTDIHSRKTLLPNLLASHGPAIEAFLKSLQNERSLTLADAAEKLSKLLHETVTLSTMYRLMKRFKIKKPKACKGPVPTSADLAHIQQMIRLINKTFETAPRGSRKECVIWMMKHGHMKARNEYHGLTKLYLILRGNITGLPQRSAFAWGTATKMLEAVVSWTETQLPKEQTA